MILIGCAGYTVNYFVSNNDRFGGQRADFSSALGCFAVGLLGNLYSRFTNGNGFAVMAPGVLFQLPSGLSASGGLLTFASTNTSSGALVLLAFATQANLRVSQTHYRVCLKTLVNPL